MSIPIFSRLFSKKEQPPSLKPIDSPVVRRLKEFASQKEYPIFNSITLYHRSNSIIIPLLLFIPKVGILLFEYKKWSFKELKNATISKVSHAKASYDSLAFENATDFIKEKFSDLTTFEDIVVYNFVIMEQLTSSEYELLEDDFHTLLPKERILFHDSTLEDIEQKISSLEASRKNYTISNTLAYIFSQYMILDDSSNIYFANKKQREAIDYKMHSVTNLIADRQSGKTVILAQKALLCKLQNQDATITIVTPTKLHANLLQDLLLKIVEASAITVDLSQIGVTTADAILNKHREKLKLPPFDSLTIEPKLLKKSYKIADYLFVDECNLLPNEFIEYLKKMQKKDFLFLINAYNEKKDLELTKSFYGALEYIQGSSTTAFKLLYKLIQEGAKDILFFTKNAQDKEFLEDLQNFCGVEVAYMDLDTPNYTKDFTPIKLCIYDQKVPFHAEYVVMTDCCNNEYTTLKYLAKAAKKRCYLIEQDRCENIQRILQIVEQENEKSSKEQ